MIRIIPAIDIIEGKCVRLRQGDYAMQTVYDDDPVKVARTYQDAGISHLHLVDLDGARLKTPVNLNILDMIARATTLQIDFGGGVRGERDIERIFSLGAAQITAGSVAVENGAEVRRWIERFGPEKIILGADVQQTNIAVSGWSETTQIDLFDFISRYLDSGIRYVICTQILRDGVLSGPDLPLYQQIKQAFPDLFLIASGGVGSIHDIHRLAEHDVDGVIIGKALYESRISLKELEPFLC